MTFLILAILVYSVILHEIAHGFMAEKLGDPTARLSQRLTLDPRPHIDPLLTIVLPGMIFLIIAVLFLNNTINNFLYPAASTLIRLLL